MNAPATPHRLTFFFGLRSPYAWLAHRLIAQHLPVAAQAAIEYVPFWAPQADTLQALREAGGEFLYRPMSRERHLYILGDLKRIVTRLGYPLKWPVDPPDQNWERPHLACLAARRSGCDAALRSRVFAARWEQGLDICDAGVLASLVGDLDLADPASLRDEAVQTLRRGHQKGVFGLPYFVVGRERFWGVDRLPFALREAGLPWRRLSAAWMGEPVPTAVAEGEPA